MLGDSFLPQIYFVLLDSEFRVYNIIIYLMNRLWFRLNGRTYNIKR